MALQGEVTLHSWCPADSSRLGGANFARGLDAVERRFLDTGGYDVVAGFSDGGNLAYKLLDRLERIQASPKCRRKLRMVALFGTNDAPFKRRPTAPASALRGLKVMHCKGDEDAGFCNSCRETITGSYFRCRECYDFDLCAQCQADLPAAVARLSKADQAFHTVDHALVKRELNGDVDVANFERLAEECGVEVCSNVGFTGGHKMPPADAKVYDYLSRFYAGKLRADP